MQGSGDRPDATFVAVAGDEVVGYAKFSLTAAQPTTAHHDLSGVKRAWRGQGVGRTGAQINCALANGYHELHTRNEQRNEPIRRLNAQFGYRPGIGRRYLVGPVSTPSRLGVSAVPWASVRKCLLSDDGFAKLVMFIVWRR